MNHENISDELIVKTAESTNKTDRTSQARTFIREYLEMSSQVLKMFDFDEWMLNKNNGDYARIAGQALSDAFKAYLNVLSASDHIMVAKNPEVKEAAASFQQAVAKIQNSVIQEKIILILNTPSGGDAITKEDLNQIHEFFTETADAGSELFNKIVEYEQNSIEL
jgi:hypothetical protein